MDERLIGRVTWYNRGGFGFLIVLDGERKNEKFFVLRSEIGVESENKYLVRGECVSFVTRGRAVNRRVVPYQRLLIPYQAGDIKSIRGGSLMCEHEKRRAAVLKIQRFFRRIHQQRLLLLVKILKKKGTIRCCICFNDKQAAVLGNFGSLLECPCGLKWSEKYDCSNVCFKCLCRLEKCILCNRKNEGQTRVYSVIGRRKVFGNFWEVEIVYKTGVF